jgi:hypothetical protein
LKGNETLAASRLNELATGVSVETDKGGGDASGRRDGGGRRGQGGGRRGQRGGAQ